MSFVLDHPLLSLDLIKTLIFFSPGYFWIFFSPESYDFTANKHVQYRSRTGMYQICTQKDLRIKAY